jgi:regulator of sigma E protease
MGGYVKFFGDKSVGSDENLDALNQLSDEEKKQSFYFKSIPQKIAVVLAGPFANIALCLCLLFSINFILGIQHTKPIIKEVALDSAAYRNQLQTGDVFLTMNGRDIQTADDVRKEVSLSFGDTIDFKILRQGNPLSLSFAPDMKEIVGEKEKMPIIGVIFTNKPEDIIVSKHDFIESVQKSYGDTVFLARITVTFLKRLVMGQADVNGLSGPIRIGDAAGDALQTSKWSFLMLMALISMSVGIVNLLPVPMLDGGHLFFYLLEAVGLKANSRVREVAFKVGFVLVISLMVFTVINDILTLGVR